MFLFLVSPIIAPFSFRVVAVTWSTKRAQLTSNDIADLFPAIAQTQDGRVWVVWSEGFDSNSILHYRVSSDLGKTWFAERNLTAEPSSALNDYPAIMQARNGTIWATWASTVLPPIPDFLLTAFPPNLTIPTGNSGQSTMIVTSVNGFTENVRFLPILDLPTGVTTSFNPTQITPPPNGQANSTLTVSVDSTAIPGNYTLTVFAKGKSQTHSIDIGLEITASGTLQSPVQKELLASSEVSPTQGETDFEIYYKTSHDNGETWSRDILFTNNAINDLRPVITQFQNGTIIILWQTYISGNADLWYKTTTDGINWSNAKQLTSNSFNDTMPALAQMKNGNIWVVWSSDRSGSSDIFYKVYNGISWSNDTPLNPASSIETEVQPAIVQAIDGNILIFWAWYNPVNLDMDLCYANSTNNGLNWSPRTLFAASTSDEEYPAVMRALDTRIWVTWASNEAEVPGSDFEIYVEGSLAGDVNSDSVIDVNDLTLVSAAYSTQPGDVYYNYNADINSDGIVDISDLGILAHYFNET